MYSLMKVFVSALTAVAGKIKHEMNAETIQTAVIIDRIFIGQPSMMECVLALLP